MKITNSNYNFKARYLITGEKEQATTAKNRMVKLQNGDIDVLQFNVGKQRAIILATEKDAKILKKKRAQKTFVSDITKILSTQKNETLYRNIFEYIFDTCKDTRWIKEKTLGFAANPIFPINMNAGNNSRMFETTTYHVEHFLDGSWKNFGASGKLNTERLENGTEIDYKDGIDKKFPNGTRIKYYKSGAIKEKENEKGEVQYFDTPASGSKLEAIKTPNKKPDEYDIVQYFYNRYDEISFLVNSDAKIGLINESDNSIQWYSAQEIDELDVSELTKSLMRDRIQQTTFADGTIMEALPNGQLTKKELSDKSVITYQEGIPVHKYSPTKKAEYFYGKYGELLFESRKHISQPLVTTNGTIISKTEIAFEDLDGNKFRFFKKDNKWLRRDFFRDGSSITRDLNGKIYDSVDKDGTIREYIHEENKEIITYPDGSAEIYIDGKLNEYFPPDRLIEDGDEYYQIHSTEADADGILALYNADDIFIGELFPTGLRTYYYGKRHQATDFPNGTREKYDPWGRRSVLVAKDGTIDKFNEHTRRLQTRIMPDKTKIEFDYDEDPIKEILPDKTIVHYYYGRNTYGWKTLLFKAYSDGRIESENGIVDQEKRTITFTKESGLKVVYNEFGNVITTGLIEGELNRIYPSAAFPGYRHF